MSLTFNHFVNSIAPDSGVLTVSATGAITLARGTTAQRPASPEQGMLRLNIDTAQVEFYSGSAWVSLQSANDDALVFALIF